MRISNKTKLILSVVLLLLLGGIFFFGNRTANQEETKNKVSVSQVVERVSALFNAVEETKRIGWQQSLKDRQDKILFSDFMGLAELLCEQELLKQTMLLELEQRIDVWQKTLSCPTETQLEEYYQLCAMHSKRQELLGCFDVYLFGMKGTAVEGRSLMTSKGKLRLGGNVKLSQGYAYSLILEQDVITELVGYANERITLKNAWLVSAEKTQMTIFYSGAMVTLPLEQPLAVSIEGVVADVTLGIEYVVGLSVKQDVITAKVLRSDQNCIELEGYGTLQLEEDFKIYKIYEELEEEQTASILVGYTATSFAMNGDKISAALITEPIQATNIRVLIQNSSYQGYFHEQLELTSEHRFFVSDGAGGIRWYEAGEHVVITKEFMQETSERIYLGTEKESGRLTAVNIKRVAGTPSYRGMLEIALLEEKLILINELSIEEYLYGVLPSEMPESFGTEALKAQAVCARSYAYNQLLANRFHQYGAHVDDSTASQVYMNYGENEAAVYAVKDTFGKIMTYQGSCVKAYYFSCSCGHTSNSQDVWGEAETEGYLAGRLQAAEGGETDLSSEDAFAAFLAEEKDWYDEDSVWFRWQTTVEDNIEEVLLKRLKTRYAQVPDKILTEQKGENGAETYVSLPVEAFGELLDLQIVRRAKSGVITELKLVGSERTYLICKEYNIRFVLAATSIITLADGSTTSNMTLLPSAYFSLEKQGNMYVIFGGGYGHGVGMSQYGAKKMAALGNSYDAILRHFYPGTELTYLYQ